MGAANVTGFELDGSGKLRPRSSSALTAGATGAAQVSVSPDGRDLVVSVRQSNRLETFPLRFGRIGAPVVTNSSGAVPFGFGFSPRGDLVVSEAGASTVSSYRLNGNGTARVISAALPVGQGAACWVVVTADGRFAYTGNASGSISGYSIARDGALTALTAGGLTAAAPRPNDLAVAGRYLYAVNPAVGEVTAYRIGERREPDAAAGRRQPRHRPGRSGRPLAESSEAATTLGCTMTVAASIILAAIVGGVIFVLLDSWQRRAATPAPAAAAARGADLARARRRDRSRRSSRARARRGSGPTGTTTTAGTTSGPATSGPAGRTARGARSRNGPSSRGWPV